MLPTPEPTQLLIDKRPVVYGYLRAERPDEIEIGLWRKELVRFCEQQGYRLEVVITDRRVEGDVTKRIGFTAVLDVLELSNSHAVVVPSLDHISPCPHTRALLFREIKRTASLVIEAHEEPGEAQP